MTGRPVWNPRTPRPSGRRSLRRKMGSWFHPPGDLYHWVYLLLLTVIAVLVLGLIERGAHL